MAVALTRIWDFGLSAEGWTGGTGTGSPQWTATAGDTEGGFTAACSGASCSFVASGATPSLGFNYTGTWESIGLPVGSTITKLLATSGSLTSYVRARYAQTTGLGTYSIGNVGVFDASNSLVWSYFANAFIGVSFTNYPATGGDSGALSIPSSDNMTLTVGYSGTGPNAGNHEVRVDEVQLLVEYTKSSIGSASISLWYHP